MRRLNLFQAMILRWRELYPYSAVHVVRVERQLDAKQLEDNIGRQLESTGLTGLSLDSARGRYAWLGGAASIKVHAVAGGGDPYAALDQEIERQLNIAFEPDGRIDPFRFFAVDAGRWFHLGLAYDHFVAGGDSIARLLKRIVEGGDGADGAGAQPELDPYAPAYSRLFRREWRALFTGVGNLRELAAECRRSARPSYASPEDGYNAFTRFRIEAPEYPKLVGVATSWGLTLRDLLLAIVLLALSPFAPGRHGSPRRREIALASIVNIRNAMGHAAASAFGPCLASFRVGHPVPPDIGLRDLAAAVHAQTDRIRRRKLYLQTLLAMAVAGFEWRFLSRRRRLRFFAKHYPVWAGVTPLNVDALWTPRDPGTMPPQYIRAVSTGPLAPMIIALTTHDETIEAGLSFRTTVYSRDAAESLAAGILASIRNLQHSVP